MSKVSVLFAAVALLLGGCTVAVPGEADRDRQARSPWCQQVCDGIQKLRENKQCTATDRDRTKFADCYLWQDDVFKQLEQTKKVLAGQPGFGNRKLFADALAAANRAMVENARDQCYRPAGAGDEPRGARCADHLSAVVSSLTEVDALVSAPGW
ncbi:hypothetical protein JOF53_005315 [Crossiella equi]|uniref:Secreted protein n=2 Tax=Crossiella equi TaxID=130796 RepID=A0ABS5AIQ1_9PSEU|nr:hypothetical protein [Crossiella equi]MBP2476443.1 hypothetical protein [Crossiella equi]